jgi:hypothetical protein
MDNLGLQPGYIRGMGLEGARGMAKRASGPRKPNADPKEASERAYQVRARLVYQVRELEKQVERLVYGSSEAKNSDLALLREVPSVLDVAFVNSEFFQRNTYRIILSTLQEIDARAFESARSLAPRFQLSKEMASATGLIIPEITNNIRSNLGLYIKYSEGLVDQNIKKPRVPPQQPAPIRVGLKNDGRLHLEISQTHKGSLPVASLEKLRAATQELLQRTVEQVGNSSNVDPRLAPNLRGMLTYLSIPIELSPIEALGLNFQFAKRSFKATRETVPDPLVEQLEQIFSTVNVMLNQYDEWRLYLAAEAVTEIDTGDLDKIVEQSGRLADLLEQNEAFVDPEISARFREIIDAYINGLVNVEAVAVPLIESVGNVFSIISQILIGYLPDGAVGAIVTPGSLVLLLGFSMKAVETFAPTMSSFPPLSYLIDVQKFGQKQFSLLKDTMIATGRN